jgi:hypothetical protein
MFTYLLNYLQPPSYLTRLVKGAVYSELEHRVA